MKNKNRENIISVAVFFSITLCLFAPFEIYFANKDEMWFRLSAFWWIPILVCFVVFGCIYTVGSILKNGIKRIYLAICFAMALCMYMQGNFLSLKVGVMNGAQIEWDMYTLRMIGNLIIWLFVIAVWICIAIFKEEIFLKVSKGIAIFLTAVQIVTLLIFFVTLVIKGDYVKNTYTFLSDEGLYKVGKDENVIIFCLDMFDDDYFKAIYENEPDIGNDFEGFTYFSNFTGTYSTTSYSLPHLFTGKIYHNEGTLNEWNDLCTEAGTYVDEFTEAGYDLDIYSIGYSVIPSKYVLEAENYVEAPLYITNYLRFSCDLYQLVACKYFPDMVKPYIWMDGTEFDYWKGYKSESRPYDGTNASFRDGLIENGVTLSESSRQFKFIHINASHYPYDIDENANDVEKDSVTDVQCARGALRMVQWYLEELKKNGGYDEAVIIITADHGYYWDGVLTSPVCLIKPKGARGVLQINSVPASQVDLPATLIELAGINSVDDYGKSIFEYSQDEDRDRFFYQYYLSETNSSWKWRLIEYKIDSAGNDRENFHLTDNEYTISGTKIPHKMYCKTCNGEYVNKEDEQKEPSRVVHVKRNNYPE